MSGNESPQVVLIHGEEDDFLKQLIKKSAKDGARVVVASPSSLENIVDAMGEECTCLDADTKTKEGLERAVKETFAKYQGIDELLHVVKVASNSIEEDYISYFEEQVDEMAQKVAQTLQLFRECMKYMKNKRSGRIVLIFFWEPTKTENKAPGSYHVLKGTIKSLVKSSAYELLKYNIRINAVDGGPINQDPLTKSIADDRKLSHVAFVSEFLAAQQKQIITGKTFKTEEFIHVPLEQQIPEETTVAEEIYKANKPESYLMGLTVSDILQSQDELIFAKEDDSVSFVLDLLTKKEILSVPVKSNHNTLLATVDVLDLIAYCASRFSTGESQSEFGSVPVKSMIGMSGRNPLVKVFHKSPFMEILHLLSKGTIHRVIAINEQGAIGFVTQFQMIEFLHKNWKNLNVEAKKSVTWKKQPGVVQIQQTESVLRAFQLIVSKGVSGIAVVDHNGVLVGGLSANDLKRTRASSSDELLKDLKEPIQKFLKEFIKVPKAFPATVKSSNTSLEHILGLVVSEHVHRVFVVDEKGCPVQVISLGDIIRQFL